MVLRASVSLSQLGSIEAIIGMFFQDGLTGSAWGDWSLYTASPLRAEAAEADEPPKPPPFDPAKQVQICDICCYRKGKSEMNS